MWRTGRALTVLVTGWVMGLSLFLTPAVATAQPAVHQQAPAVRVANVSQRTVAEQAPVERAAAGKLRQQPPDQPQHPLPANQRVTVGVIGIVLIALVLLSRKWRKKPMVYIPKFWKSK